MRFRVLLLLLILVCSGCASIPTEGPIDEVPIPEDSAGIEIAPQPPRGDDEPAQIIEGFLLAMSEADTTYRTARTYLTAEAAQRWEPGRSTQVFQGSVLQADGHYLLQGVLLGEIDETDRFQPRGEPLRHDFGLVEKDGQWRINNPPDGVLLSRYLFTRNYRQVTIYFSAQDNEVGVPELLTIPEGEVSPGRIVEAVLRGPSERMQSVVRNALPSGAKLGDGGASVDEDGIATVDLTGVAPSMPPEQRRRLGAQLLWSLTSVPRVTGLKITVDGTQFTLPGQSADGVLELATQQGYSVLSRTQSQDLFAVQDHTPGTLNDHGRFVPLAGELPPSAEVAISIDGTQMALIGEDRQTVFVGPRDDTLTPITPGFTNIHDGQWALGYLYALGDDAQGMTRLFRVSAQHEVEVMDARLPASMALRGFSVHQTGTVAAVLGERNGSTHLGRMVASKPGVFDRWQELPPSGPSGRSITRIDDVQWNSESTIVLAGDVDESWGVVVVSADGAFVEEIGSFRESIQGVAALPRQGGGLIALRGSAGVVWRYTAPNRWAHVDVKVADLAFAG